MSRSDTRPRSRTIPRTFSSRIFAIVNEVTKYAYVEVLSFLRSFHVRIRSARFRG